MSFCFDVHFFQGFEKVQELIFSQFNGKVINLDLSLLKQIVEDLKGIIQGTGDGLDNVIPFVLS